MAGNGSRCELFKSEALNEDGENNNYVGNCQNRVPVWTLGKGKSESNGNPAPEAAPCQDFHCIRTEIPL